MATPENIHRELLDAITRGDFEAAATLFHPDYEYTGGDGQRHSGAETGVAIAKMYKTAFPDMKPEILSTITKGETAVTEFRVRGTHSGELAGIAPTGKAIDLTICNVVEVRDGKVYREREYFDSMTMWSQLGLAEPPGA